MGDMDTMGLREFCLPLVTINEDVKGDLTALLQRIKPEWNEEDIEIERIQMGYLNIVWLCYTLSDAHRDKIIVRINRTDVGEKWKNNPSVAREYEYTVMKEMSRIGIIPKVYCKFSNGMAYQYISGKDISHDELLQDHILKKAVIKLHQIHSVQMPIRNTSCSFLEWNMTTKRLNLLPELPEKFETEELQNMFEESLISKSYLGNLVEEHKHILEDLYSKYPLIFCHQDPWYNNIIFDKEKDCISFIDWEFSGHAVVPFDLFWLAQTWDKAIPEKIIRKVIGAYLVNDPLPNKRKITEELQNQWYKDVIRAGVLTSLSVAIYCAWLAVREETIPAQMVLLTFSKGAMEIFHHTSSVAKTFD